MSTKIGRLILAGALGSILAMAAPAFGQGHSGGGHAGGGHASAGGHVSAGGHGYAGGHGALTHGYGYAGAGHGGYGYGGYGGHGGYGGGYYHGYSTGHYWGGGYWHGGWWPRAYYGLGFAWFLPVLPLAYATYWYGGIPYYYANDVYYTWNPGYDGYTVTDPPPLADDSGAAAGPAPGDYQGSGQGPGQVEAPMQGGGQVFMYPKNGQSAEQQSTDKRECEQWASSQADPSRVDEYRRAMMACIQGRGYSAQ